MRAISIALTVLLSSAAAQAAVPQLVNFQGTLSDNVGNPVADGTYSVVFTIYTAQVFGTAKWTETQNVTTSGGQFGVLLGSVNAIPDSVFSGPDRWLGIKVEADPEMAPRTRLASIGYSYRVSSVDGSLGGYISGDVKLDTTSASSGSIYRGGKLFLSDYGLRNHFIGENAGNLSTTGRDNTSLGYQALRLNAGGYGNTAIGSFALEASTSGERNVGVGYGSLADNTTGNNNVAVGSGALQANVDGHNNCALGYAALVISVSGHSNTALGSNALLATTGGYQNTAVGFSSLSNNTNGINNTAVGDATLLGNVDGNSNVAIGNGADVASGSLSNAVAIGSGTVVNASNKVRIGNTSVSVIEGQVAYTFTSDRNQKENFQPMDESEVLEKLSGIDVSSWNYKGQDPAQFRHYGPTAQDFHAAFGDDGVGNVGSETTINSGDLTGILMISVQALAKENAELKSRLENLETLVEELSVK